MAIQKEYWDDQTTLGAATAETITITECRHYLRITTSGGNATYLKFDWATGDTEVSATNFDAILTDAVGNSIVFAYVSKRDPVFHNVRVLSAGTPTLAFLGW